LSETRPTVTVTRKGEDRIVSGHPWIFAGDVSNRGSAQPGDAVRVVNQRGRGLGTAHYSATSQITLRMLSRKDEAVDRPFFLRRLQHALAHREQIVQDSDAFRLVHAEGDLLPGLIVDRYGDCLVAQFLDQGMDRAAPEIVSALEELLQPRSIVARNDVAVRRHESLPLETKVLRGEAPGRIEVRFNGLRWWIDPLAGQKTGVYLDQRENYHAAERFARGRALDCFTSTGGFALHLARRCEQVEAVDSSAPALELARANASLNGIAGIEFREANVFDLLSGYVAAQRQFETIVLDPPAFAKSRANVDSAARGYKEINYKALKILAPGGVLVTCSCSHHFSEADLLETVAAAALDANRTLRVLERRTQSPDHPILLTVPETLYLKCLILESLS
jgi:23S rRNA (cytosine1962-C5)-methyltransferase